MANANTEVTLEQVHDAIVASIRAQFPGLKTVEAYRLDRKNLPVPACLIELTEMEITHDAFDPGTEQLAVTARFEARLLIGFKTPRAKLSIRQLAAALAHFARTNRWGVPVGPGQVIGAYPDDFDPELDQYECWRVEWTNVVHIGAPTWEDAGTTPTSALYSWAPNIGPGHESHYRPLPELLPPGAELPGVE